MSSSDTINSQSYRRALSLIRSPLDFLIKRKNVTKGEGRKYRKHKERRAKVGFGNKEKDALKKKKSLGVPL